MTSEEQLTEHPIQWKAEPVEQAEWEFKISTINFSIKIRNDVGNMKQEQSIMGGWWGTLSHIK